MPRLRNKVTGAVVNVSDATAVRMSREWSDAGKVGAEPKEPAKRGGRPRKAESDD